MLFCEFLEIFKNTFCTDILEWLLLYINNIFIIWKDTKAEFIALITELNNKHKRI